MGSNDNADLNVSSNPFLRFNNKSVMIRTSSNYIYKTRCLKVDANGKNLSFEDRFGHYVILAFSEVASIIELNLELKK